MPGVSICSKAIEPPCKDGVATISEQSSYERMEFILREIPQQRQAAPGAQITFKVGEGVGGARGGKRYENSNTSCPGNSGLSLRI